MLTVLLLGAIVLQVWAWRRLRRQLLAAEIDKSRALLSYAGWALLPVLVAGGILLAAIGAEELSGRTLVPESLARTALPLAAVLLGMATVGWLAFLVACALVWRSSGRGP